MREWPCRSAPTGVPPSKGATRSRPAARVTAPVHAVARRAQRSALLHSPSLTRHAPGCCTGSGRTAAVAPITSATATVPARTDQADLVPFVPRPSLHQPIADAVRRRRYVYGSAVAVLRYRYRYRSSVRTTRTRTYVHGTVHVLHVVHMYTNTGTFVLYMYILIHAYMYATESKVLGLDQIGVFQTTEPSLYYRYLGTRSSTGRSAVSGPSTRDTAEK